MLVYESAVFVPAAVIGQIKSFGALFAQTVILDIGELEPETADNIGFFPDRILMARVCQPSVKVIAVVAGFVLMLLKR